jgi:hypothetical protein
MVCSSVQLIQLLKKYGIILIVAAFMLIVATILFLFNPEQVSFYPRCPFNWLTGYKCPGCGSLRGIHALLHGDFARAWELNAALFFALPAILFFALSRWYPAGSIADRIVGSQYTSRVVLMAILGWWIARLG